MNRDREAYSLPTIYDRILVTCSSATSHDHMPDEVHRLRINVTIKYRFSVRLCNMNVIITLYCFPSKQMFFSVVKIQD